MSPRERFSVLLEKGFCFQCLFPGALVSKGKYKEGRCQHDFCCPHKSHDKYSPRQHVLACDEHKHLPANIDLLRKYKEMYIVKRQSLPSFSKYLHITQQSSYTSPSPNDAAIYLLQRIQIGGRQFLMFFDTGCSDFLSKYDAIQNLPNNFNLVHPGPVSLGGVGDISTESRHGIYSVSFPVNDGSKATFVGPCLDKVTSKFPTYQL